MTTTATAVSNLRSPLRSIYQTLISTSTSTSINTLSRPFSSSRYKPAGDAPEPDLGDRPPRLFVVQPRLRPDYLLNAKLSEALNLANSLEEQRDGRYQGEFGEKKTPPFSVVQNPLARSGGHADTFFGQGTVENIKCNLNAMASEDDPDAVFVNAILSGVQQRNLERAWGKPVLDRIGLIIEIFNAHAQTKEAKLQSELAALMYKRTRLVRVRGPDGRLTFGISGEAEVVSAKGKGSGGRGFLSGAGESEIQLQRRRIQERREYLLREIEDVRKTRALQRYARKRRGGSEGQGLATVAVVGYTNAGKSTLVSALSQNDLYRDDRLFATVDPRLRSVILPSGRKVLLSDTVGFISDLPVQLIEAFHATLEEVVDADLLVHVIDSCAKNLEEQRSAVLEVLNQIGVSKEKIQNMIEVWNKIDLVNSESKDMPTLGENFDSCNDGDGSSSDEEAVSLDGSLEETINECSEPNLFLEKEDRNLVELQGDTADGEHKCEVNSLEILEQSTSIEVGNSEPSFENAALSRNKQDQHYRSSEMGTSASCTIDHARIEASAITGVGLQELLYLIDEKLGSQESSQRQVNFIDRKWRPSYYATET